MPKHAKANRLQQGFSADATIETTGLVLQRTSTPNPANSISTGDLFCGGFPGWSQAESFPYRSG